MHDFHVFSEIIVLGRYVDIGHIATLPAREYDLFPEGGIFLEDDFALVFRGEYGAEESGGASSDDYDVVHEKMVLG